MIHIHKHSAPLNRAKVFVPQEGTDWCVTEKCSSAILISPSTTYFWDFWAPQHMALSRNSIHTAALWYQGQWSCQNNQRCPLGYVKYWDFHAWMWHQDSQCCPGAWYNSSHIHNSSLFTEFHTKIHPHSFRPQEGSHFIQHCWCYWI